MLTTTEQKQLFRAYLDANMADLRAGTTSLYQVFLDFTKTHWSQVSSDPFTRGLVANVNLNEPLDFYFSLRGMPIFNPGEAHDVKESRTVFIERAYRAYIIQCLKTHRQRLVVELMNMQLSAILSQSYHFDTLSSMPDAIFKKNTKTKPELEQSFNHENMQFEAFVNLYNFFCGQTFTNELVEGINHHSVLTEKQAIPGKHVGLIKPEDVNYDMDSPYEVIHTHGTHELLNNIARIHSDIQKIGTMSRQQLIQAYKSYEPDSRFDDRVEVFKSTHMDLPGVLKFANIKYNRGYIEPLKKLLMQVMHAYIVRQQQLFPMTSDAHTPILQLNTSAPSSTSPDTSNSLDIATPVTTLMHIQPLRTDLLVPERISMSYSDIPAGSLHLLDHSKEIWFIRSDIVKALFIDANKKLLRILLKTLKEGKIHAANPHLRQWHLELSTVLLEFFPNLDPSAVLITNSSTTQPPSIALQASSIEGSVHSSADESSSRSLDASLVGTSDTSPMTRPASRSNLNDTADAPSRSPQSPSNHSSSSRSRSTSKRSTSRHHVIAPLQPTREPSPFTLPTWSGSSHSIEDITYTRTYTRESPPIDYEALAEEYKRPRTTSPVSLSGDTQGSVLDTGRLVPTPEPVITSSLPTTASDSLKRSIYDSRITAPMQDSTQSSSILPTQPPSVPSLSLPSNVFTLFSQPSSEHGIDKTCAENVKPRTLSPRSSDSESD